MKEGFKKIVFYGTFSALGVFWAEVMSTNIPFGLIVPPLYLAYGLLYVFFIDALMRWDGRDFRMLYLFGVLVGLITETYVAKVTFYGLAPEAPRILGVAPGVIMFIILFYHAFFSFLAPLYFARRVLNMPLPISPKKWIDISCLLASLIILPAVCKQLVDRGLTVLVLMRLIGISAIVLFLWILLLRSLGEIKDVLLSKKERVGLLIFTVLIYAFFLFKVSNKVHGHAPTDFPLIPMLVVTGIIVGLLLLLFRTLARDKEPRNQVLYSAKSINLPLFLAWLFWHFSITTVLLLLQSVISPFLKLALLLLGLTGAAVGVLMFVISVFCLVRNLR